MNERVDVDEKHPLYCFRKRRHGIRLLTDKLNMERMSPSPQLLAWNHQYAWLKEKVEDIRSLRQGDPEGEAKERLEELCGEFKSKKYEMDVVAILCVSQCRSPKDVENKVSLVEDLIQAEIFSELEIESKTISLVSDWANESYASLAMLSSNLQLAEYFLQRFPKLNELKSEQNLNLFHFLCASDPTKCRLSDADDALQTRIFDNMVAFHGGRWKARAEEFVCEIAHKLTIAQILIFADNIELFDKVLNDYPLLATKSSTLTRQTPIFAICFQDLFIKASHRVHFAATLLREAKDISQLINQRSAAFGYTPLMTCMLRANRSPETLTIAKMLLCSGHCELGHKGTDSFTALTITLFYLDWEACNLLLRKGRFRAPDRTPLNARSDYLLRLKIKLDKDCKGLEERTPQGMESRLYDLSIEHGEQGYPYSYCWKRLRSVHSHTRNPTMGNLRMLDMLGECGGVFRAKPFPRKDSSRRDIMDASFEWCNLMDYFGYVEQKSPRARLDRLFLDMFVRHVCDYRTDGKNPYIFLSRPEFGKRLEIDGCPIAHRMESLPHSLLTLSILFGSYSSVKLCLQSRLAGANLRTIISGTPCEREILAAHRFETVPHYKDKTQDFNLFLKPTTAGDEEQCTSFCFICGLGFDRSRSKLPVLHCGCEDGPQWRCEGRVFMCADCFYFKNQSRLNKHGERPEIDILDVAKRKCKKPGVTNYVSFSLGPLGKMLYEIGMAKHNEAFVNANILDMRVAKSANVDLEMLKQIGVGDPRERDLLLATIRGYA